jgi:uncharacterized protein (DUF924 family)
MGWQSEVLDFWFGLRPEQWWKADDALDEACRERFRLLWTEQRQLPPRHFLGSASSALAAVILFDQMPRNMFRGNAEQFATDPLALAVAKGAVERAFDTALSPPERGFLYMPFQHSEDMADQKRSLTLFTALGDDFQLRYATLHHDVIERFGRFPHRNPALGRQTTSEEQAFLDGGGFAG